MPNQTETEDLKHFGEGSWVYCSQHMRPHTVGWCTVAVRDKTKLTASNYETAKLECRERGLDLYGETPNTIPQR